MGYFCVATNILIVRFQLYPAGIFGTHSWEFCSLAKVAIDYLKDHVGHWHTLVSKPIAGKNVIMYCLKSFWLLPRIFSKIHVRNKCWSYWEGQTYFVGFVLCRAQNKWFNPLVQWISQRAQQAMMPPQYYTLCS
jgi:hypothetical protein